VTSTETDSKQSLGGALISHRVLSSEETYLTVLQSILNARCPIPATTSSGASVASECGFQSGFVGYFGYEMKSETEPHAKHSFIVRKHNLSSSLPSSSSSSSSDSGATKSGASTHTDSKSTDATSSSGGASVGAGVVVSSVPDACFMFADRTIIFDHQTQSCHLLCLCLSTPPISTASTSTAATVATADIKSAKQWLQSTKATLAELPTTALDDLPAFSATSVSSSTGSADLKSSAPAKPTVTPPPVAAQFKFRHNKQAYLAAIRECQEQIRYVRLISFSVPATA
jgi:anthranilate/para-aminobenzoate synthase component I